MLDFADCARQRVRIAAPANPLQEKPPACPEHYSHQFSPSPCSSLYPPPRKDTWQLDPPHSSAQFSVRHLGVSTVRGAFTKVSGTVHYDAANPAKSRSRPPSNAASVDTRVEMRDNDLRSPRFLDAQKYPTITFQSKKVEAVGEGKLKVTGDLTIHGVTKEVVLDVDGPYARDQGSDG